MKWVRKFHLYSSVLVGLQVIIWIGTGIIFNVMDHEKASGNSYRVVEVKPVFTIDPNTSHDLVPITQILLSYPDTVEVELINILNAPHYLLYQHKGLYRHFVHEFLLVNAVTSMPTKLTEAMIKQIAQQSYKGPGQITNAIRLSDGGEFLKERNPSWRVDFSDQANTSAYIDATTGRVLGHSNDDRRFRDLLFMLHFMDYAEVGGFNNVFIKIFALIALCLSISGTYWLLVLVKKRQIM